MQDQHNNQQQTQNNSARKPLVAALMSVALPGLGQMYNGQFNKAIWIFLLFSITAIPLIAIIALLLPAALTAPLVALSTALTLGIWIYAIVDGWRVASRLQRFQLREWQTSGVYLLVFLICATVVLPSTLLWVRKYQVEPFRIPSGSMEPSVLRGDMIFANKNYNCPNCLVHVKRGDVAIFVYPDNRSQHYIKRVIGLPGDKIALEGNIVSINGERLNSDAEPNTERFDGRSWQVQWSENQPADVKEFTVQHGHAFVLGDNRSRSNDSRVFGQVPLADIVGKARQVWFSQAEDGIRWSRIGQLLN
jgi:signal peptidase I